MRGRTTSMVETPVSQNMLGERSLQIDNRRASLSSTALNKMAFNEKLERYQILLEKEYELRAKLSKEYGIDCEHHNNATLVCNCGRRLTPTTTTTTPATPPTSTKRNSMPTSLYPPQQQPLHIADSLTPPMVIMRYRSNSEKIKRSERVRPLSADISLNMKSAAAIRRLTTEQKMGKRRDSLKSLQDDFDKAKFLIQRARASSNGSIQFDNNNNNNNNINNNSSSNPIKNDISPKRCSNDSGHFSSNESIASTSSQDMSNAVSNYIASRRKERPLSSYI